MSPTQRSLAYLRRAGYHVAIVEHYNVFAHIRQDLFGFADLFAFRIGLPVMLVQTTDATNASKRRAKILQNVVARDWVRDGNEVVLHKWGKRGGRGERKVWECNPEWITKDQFGEEDAP